MAWFNFGRQDLGADLESVRTEQGVQRQMLALALQQIGVLVALVSIDQTVLDELGNTLQTVADGVQSIIDDPDNDLGPADLSAVTDAVSRLQALVANPETPVEPTPDAPADGDVSGTPTE